MKTIAILAVLSVVSAKKLTLRSAKVGKVFRYVRFVRAHLKTTLSSASQWLQSSIVVEQRLLICDDIFLHLMESC